MGAAGLTSFIAASISCSPSHESTTQESDMATGWAGDGAVQDQIDATVKDAIKRWRSQLPQGPSLRRCEECDVEIPEAPRRAVPGEMGRTHVRTPVTIATLACCLLLVKKK